MRSAAAIALATLVVAAGCGGGEGLSDTDRDRLAARVQQARTAAEGRDAGGVLRALTSFRANVRAAARRGELSKQDADRLLAGALQAQRRVRAEITPEPTPAPTPTATAVPAPPAPARGKKPKDKGKGHDKGGKGGD